MARTMAVIGGGPAGLYAAIEGARRGFAVTLYERGAVGDKICCGEGFFDTLNRLGPPEAGVLFQVSSVLVRVKERHRIGGLPINVWMIDRRRWQRKLAERARAMGVNIRENTPLSREQAVELTTTNKWVVDASGPRAITRPPGNRAVRCAVTYQTEMEGDFRFLEKGLYIGLEPELYAYYWMFPRGDYQAKVGLGWFDPSSCHKKGLTLRGELERIIKKENLQSYRITKKEGGVIPVEIRSPLVKDNLLYAGDAAGLASPLHGGGIDMACLSGLEAAVAAAEDRPEAYEGRVRCLVEQRQTLEAKLLALWQGLSWDELDSLMRLAAHREKLNLASLWRHRSQLAEGLRLIKAFLFR